MFDPPAISGMFQPSEFLECGQFHFGNEFFASWPATQGLLVGKRATAHGAFL